MAEAATTDDKTTDLPTCVIVLGMAGCGKTSLVSRLSKSDPKPYIINLDPACINLPYFANIDVRDTIDYKEVMRKYQLGPNGSIVTSLNLFSTQFLDVTNFIAKCGKRHCVIDTPGQIEVFTWSASGNIITETLASMFPTVIAYVIDIDRNTQPVTFMSNMVYACSILYKTCLPFVIVMNKIDVVRHDFALEWMRDFNAFRDSFDTSSGYLGNLHASMTLVLDEFYKDLKVCGVSAVTGEGIDELFVILEAARVEYETEYKVEKQRLIKKRAEMMEVEAAGGESSSNNLKDDITLRLPANDGVSSSDSEGGETEGEECNDSDEENDKFKTALKQQKELLAKRAQQPAVINTK